MAKSRKKSHEIALIGEVDSWEADVVKELLDIPEAGECTFYIDSSGGSVYSALAITTLMLHRKLRCKAIVLGECSSACLLIFAACQTRLVTRYSTFLFHHMRWQSEKRVISEEATRWARHFEEMEKEIDTLQERLLGEGGDKVRAWTKGSYYVAGPQLVDAGLADLVEI